MIYFVIFEGVPFIVVVVTIAVDKTSYGGKH